MYTDKFTTAQALLMPEDLAGIELAIEGAIDLMVHHWPKITQIKTNAEEVTISLGIKLTPSGKQTKIQHRISYSETYKDSREDITEDPDQTQLFNDQPTPEADMPKTQLMISDGSTLAVPMAEIIPIKRGPGRPRKDAAQITDPEAAPQPEAQPIIDAEIIPEPPQDVVYSETGATQEPAEADCPL